MRKLIASVIALFACMAGGGIFAQDAALFERLDANKDGFISADEVKADTKALFERLIDKFDKNKDGKLDKDEFAAGTKAPDRTQPAETPRERPRGEQPKPEGQPAQNPGEAFKFLDRNGDGKLQKDELPERMRDNFDRLDANRDGAIDPTEFARVAGQLPGRRPEGAPAEGARVEARRFEEMFAQLDANKDGKVTLDEVPEDKKEQFKQMATRIGAEEKGVTKEQFIRLMAGGERRPAEAGRPGEPRRPEGQPSFAPPLFVALDTNKDGELSAEEIANAPKSLAALDKNGDGKITRDELGTPPVASRPPEGRPGVEEMLKRLKEADKNGDGKLSKEEAPERLKENFDRIDANGDGFLDEAELKQVVQRLLGR